MLGTEAMNSAAPQESQVGAVEGAAELVRTYQAWEGDNIFCLGGRFIFGPDARSVFLTIFLIVAPAAIFCVFVARKLMDDYAGNWGIAIMVVCIVFTLCVLVLLLLTSARDPGIIPCNANPPEPEGYENSLDFGTALLPQTKDVVINGMTVKIKYCNTCKLYRPPRCSHCSICDNCVERFDHHCPWAGQCIGLRNYRFFFMFVFSTTLLCLYAHGFCWVYIKRIMNSEKTSLWKAMTKTPASIALITYTFLALWFVGGLLVFHLYLISTNQCRCSNMDFSSLQTTNENYKYRCNMHDNPYNRGIVRNFMEVFCSSIPASKNKFRAKVQKKSLMPPYSVGAGFDSTHLGSEMWERGKAIWGDPADRVLAVGSDRIAHVNSDNTTENWQ